MAQAQSENTDYELEFEPEFEVTELPVEKLSDIKIERVEKLPDIETDQKFIRLKSKQEGARSTISLLLMGGFIILLLTGMILGFLIEGDKIGNIREVMLTVSGILSGPVGFVVGYYFRRSEE